MGGYLLAEFRGKILAMITSCLLISVFVLAANLEKKLEDVGYCLIIKYFCANKIN